MAPWEQLKENLLAAMLLNSLPDSDSNLITVRKVVPKMILRKVSSLELTDHGKGKSDNFL